MSRLGRSWLGRRRLGRSVLWCQMAKRFLGWFVFHWSLWVIPPVHPLLRIPLGMCFCIR